MIIQQFNTTAVGGAAVAANRLHHGLLQRGVQSTLNTLSAPSSDDPAKDDQGVQSLRWPSHSTDLAKRLRLKLSKVWYRSGRSRELEIFTDPRVARRTVLPKSMRNPQTILHLHWVSRWLDFPTFFDSVPDHLPVVWTLHDMNAFTGGCHHADQCHQFQTGCGNCPQIKHRGPSDLSNKIVQIKQQAYRGKRLHVVTPSQWLADLAGQSLLLEDASSIEVIRNGVDTDVFQPRDKAASKHALGIAPQQFVIGFGAASLGNPRKGLSDLIAAAEQLRSKQEITALAFGASKPELEDQMPLPMRSTGFVSNPEHQADIYSAMDVFVLPSWAENLPQTAIEAMACGVPVIAYDVGGLPEIVQHQVTGLTSPLRGVEQLAKNIDALHSDPALRQSLSVNSRQFILQHYTMQSCVQAYHDLYQRISAASQDYAARAA